MTQVGDAQMIQVHQRRSSTPNVLSGTTTSTLPIQFSGVGPNGQKVILTQLTNSQSPGPGNGQGGHTVVPLIRPMQPGSPIIVRATPAQNQQFFQQQVCFFKCFFRITFIGVFII